MALRIVREVNRSLGFPIASGTTFILSGQPLMLDSTGASLKPFDGTSTDVPYGLALEDSVIPPLQGLGGMTAGQGYDYTNFARGGLYSVMLDGGEAQLYDDGRGAPFVTTDTYTVNQAVYANSNGEITSDAAGGDNPLVGYCTAVTGSPVTQLQVKLAI